MTEKLMVKIIILLLIFMLLSENIILIFLYINFLEAENKNILLKFSKITCEKLCFLKIIKKYKKFFIIIYFILYLCFIEFDFKIINY